MDVHCDGRGLHLFYEALGKSWLKKASLTLGSGYMVKRLLGAAFCAAFSVALVMVMALEPAVAGAGQPTDGQIGFQAPVTEVAREIHALYNMVNYIIIAITLFVLVLMAYVMWRFREKSNPTPSKTTHNTFLEVAWTIIPIFILIAIAVPSFKLLYLQYSFPKPDVTIKATGNAWFWSYQYPDQGEFEISSYALSDEDAKAAGKPRLLAVDNEIVVPVNKVVHMLVTSNDVIHNWTIPSFGSKIDAVPGRTTLTWFKAEKEGVYYGQCSELCGKDHAKMPIAVRVVSDDVYSKWIEAWKEEDEDAARDLLSAIPQAPDEAHKQVANVIKTNN